MIRFRTSRSPAEQTPPRAGGARRILVLFAHPSPERSEVGRPLAEVAARVRGVTLIDLYAQYPTFDIDVDLEQDRLRRHDVVCFLHPLYWYSTPAILKEWQDLVLEYGFAYGAGGTVLHGKLFFSALTAGGPEAAYRAQGYNHFTIRELLQPLEQTAILCGMTYLPPFAVFSARLAAEQGRLPDCTRDWTRLLEALRDDRLDVDAARGRPRLNADLDGLLRAPAGAGSGP